MEHLFTDPYVPFTVAILVMLLLAAIEAIGLGLSAIDIDLGIDHDTDADAGGILSYLGVGTVPLLMVLICFLTLFGVSGLVVQNFAREIFGEPLSLLLAVPAALAATLPLLGLTSRLLARIMPKDETTVISEDDMLGRRANIITGTAYPGHPAQARLVDRHGQAHFLMVEPTFGTVSEGDEIVLVRKEGAVFVGAVPYSSDFRPTI